MMEWWDYIGLVASGLSLVTLFLTTRLWFRNQNEKARLDKKVQIRLQSPTKKLELPAELRRKETTRQEVLGRIGMIPMKTAGKRFEIQYTNTQEFFIRLNEVIDGQDDDLIIIICTDKELEQFNLANFQHLIKPL